MNCFLSLIENFEQEKEKARCDVTGINANWELNGVAKNTSSLNKEQRIGDARKRSLEYLAFFLQLA